MSFGQNTRETAERSPSRRLAENRPGFRHRKRFADYGVKQRRRRESTQSDERLGDGTDGVTGPRVSTSYGANNHLRNRLRAAGQPHPAAVVGLGIAHRQRAAEPLVGI